MAEPVNKHDPRCLIWLSDDPADGCDCRDHHGHTPRDLPDPITRRQQLEDEWRSLSLAERCARLDHLAS